MFIIEGYFHLRSKKFSCEKKAKINFSNIYGKHDIYKKYENKMRKKKGVRSNLSPGTCVLLLHTGTQFVMP
jgi:hypothetical protein